MMPMADSISQMIKQILNPSVNSDGSPASVAKKSPYATGKTTEQLLQDVKVQRGPPIKKKSGGKVSSASKRADGCITKGKTKGRMV